MPQSLRFQGINSVGIPVQITVTSQENLKPEENIDIALQQIALDAARQAKEQNVSVSVEQSDHTLSYDLSGEKKQIALSAIDKPKVLLDLVQSKIIPVSQTPGLESLIDRFSVAPPGPKTIYEKIAHVLACFFEIIRASFQYISQLWGGISPSEKKLKWDIAVLTEICQSASPEKLTQIQALEYMAKMLEQERSELSDPSLKERIKGAALLSKKIDHLRHHFREKTFDFLIKEVRSRIDRHPVLLPVGFHQKGALQEMLLEIAPAANGTYSLALISASEGMREHFDRHMGVETVSQSIRREIVNVGKEDLLGAIPLLIELQISPGQDQLMTFLRALEFDGSSIPVSEANEAVSKSASPGPLGELISYAASAKVNPEEGKRFELALRLKAFLDIAKSGDFKNQGFWTLVRTTGLQLAHLIEKDKQLLGSKDAQGMELTRIYHELVSLLDELAVSLPELKGLNYAPRFSSPVSFKSEPLDPKLTPLEMEPHAYPEVRPPLSVLNAGRPLESIKTWALRLEKLSEIKQIDRAGYEAKLMVRMLPNPTDPFWKSLSGDLAKEGIKALQTICNAISRGAKNKSEASLQDIGSLCALTYFADSLALRADPLRPRADFRYIREKMQELQNSHLSLYERNWLSSIAQTLDPGNPLWNPNRSQSPMFEDALHKLLDATPLQLRSPGYAKALLKETNNASLLEYCPFGCGKDDHFDLAHDYEKYDYPTAYLLHHNAVFNPKILMKEGTLYRDEAADMIYLQQTNQDPFNFRLQCNRETALDLGFSIDDRRIQLMNTLALYFSHPHFFKHPALRFEFEAKLFNYETFSSLLDPNHLTLNQPFLEGVLNRLAEEIHLSRAAEDLGTASYLVFIAAEMKELIEASTLSLTFPFDCDKLLLEWATEIVGDSDVNTRMDQKMIFPLLLSRFFNKFCRNAADPCFDDPKTQELLVLMIGRLQTLTNDAERIDPEKRDQCLSLLHWIAPKIRAQTIQDKNFINQVLATFNPRLANLGLEWDAQDFPTLLALDKQGQVYQFDLLSGKMIFGSKRIEPLPEKIRWNQQVQRICGSAVNEHWQLYTPDPKNPGSIAYLSEAIPDFRILALKQEDLPGAFQRKSKLVFQKKIGKEWMTRLNVADLPNQAALVAGNSDCWIDQKGRKIYVVDQDKKTPRAILNIDFKYSLSWSGLESQQVISNIWFPDEEIYLLNPEKEKLARFTSIEDSRFIQVKGHRFSPSSVQYLRYQMADNGAPLSYEIHAKGIESKMDPGYLLQPFGSRPGKNDPAIGSLPLPRTFDGFHLLSKGGNEKVLLPMLQYKPDFSVGGTNLPHSKPVFPETLEPCPVYEYSVDAGTNRLVAKSAEAYAYLAYICFTHSDYDAACLYLSRARTCSDFGENREKIAFWMREAKDASPNGVALQLRFELLYASKQGAETDKEILVRIAELYNHYKNHTRIAGEEGRDALLDLTPREEEELTECIQKLLGKWGDEEIVLEASSKMRPASIPELEILNNDPIDALGIRSSAKMIWQMAEKSSQSQLALSDPVSSLRHFRDFFNRILAANPASVEFHQLEETIRIPCRHIGQNYLLKLISAKKQNALGTIKPLPPLEKSWYESSRAQAMTVADRILSPPYLDRFAIALYSRAREKASTMSWSHDPVLKSFGSRIQQWLQRNGQQNFQSRFQAFLLEALYGSAGAAAIQQLNQTLALLDPIQISHPNQTQDPLEAVPLVAPTTIRLRYSHLAPPEEEPTPLPEKALPPPPKNESIGAWMAGLFFRFEEEKPPALPPPPVKMSAIVPKVTTDPIEIRTILDEKYQGFFIKEALQPIPVDDSFFDRITDPLLTRLKVEHRRDLLAYAEERTNVSISRPKAELLRANLAQDREEHSKAREQLKRAALQKAELFETEAGTLALRRLVGKGVKPTLDTLISLWRRGEIGKIAELGLKQLSAATLTDLDQSIQNYLEAAIFEDQIGRVLDLLDSYLASNDDALLRENVFEALLAKRHFGRADPDARDLLFLEYTQEIVLRKQQVEILREMLSDPDAVRQLRMGDGKSKVLLPLLAERKATGENLVMLMLPEELYETNCQDLDNTNRHLFGQTMKRFDFSRNSDRSEKELRLIQKMLLKTMRDKGFVMTTKTSLLSFRNAFLELLAKLPKTINPGEKKRLIGQIRAMSEILMLFLEKTSVIADEIDACLDVRKEVNYSLNESQSLDKVKGDIGFKLMELILERELLSELALALQQNTQAAISPERREELLRELAKSYLRSHPVRGITPEAFADYTANKATSLDIEAKIFAIKDSDTDLFQELTTVKAFIERGFGMTFGRVGNVNYGRDPISGTWTIPYKASNTPRVGSEFDEDIEKIAFAMQDYLQNGVTKTQLHKIISEMHKAARNELKAADPKSFLSLGDTESGKEFKEFLKGVDPEQKLGHNMTLSRLDNPENIGILAKIINSTPKARIGFCHKQVVRKMRQFPEQIHSVALDAADIVDHFGGFSGTPWNLHTYHDKIHAKKNLGVDGSTWALMLGRDIPVVTFDFDAEKPFDSLLDNLQMIGHAQALIDTGAYLRGTENSDFIDRALEKANGKIKAGIYFDQKGHIVKKANGKVEPIEIAPETDLMDNLTLYDQAHTIGADIKQGRNAKAIVTIGENTFIRDLFQAVWRLRQFHRGQKVILAVSNKIKERILAGENRPLSKEDILKFCLKNEALRETEDNYRSEREKIEGAAKRLFVHEIAKVIAGGADENQIENLARTAEKTKLFIKERAEEKAYDQYGALKTFETPEKIFERSQDAEMNRCGDLAFAFEKVSPAISDAFFSLGVEVEERAPIQSELCPPLMNSRHQEGGEVELEAMAETEEETELAAEIETEQELELIAETLIPQVGNGSGGHGIVQPLIEHEISQAIDETLINRSKLRRLSDTLEFFDPEILVSTMFERNLLESKSNYAASPQYAFYSNRKPVKQVLIAKQKNHWTLIIPSTHEAHGPCRSYFKNAPQDVEAVQLYLTTGRPILSHKSGKERTDALPFISKEDQEQFYRLYVQAKLFNGEIEYIGEEKQALKKWLLEKGPEKFKQYFEENILPAKPKRFETAYWKSSLAKIFAELIPNSASNLEFGPRQSPGDRRSQVT